MIDWLTGTAFRVAGTGTTWAELLGFATAVLYLVFLALCVLGLRAWRADLRRAAGPTAVPSGPATVTA